MVYAAAFFFRSAQRLFMAWPIFLRASADRVRFRLRPSGFPDNVRLLFVLPRKAAIASSRRSRSASSSAMIEAVSIFGGVLFSVRIQRAFRIVILGTTGGLVYFRAS